MANMELIVWVEPRATRFRQVQKATTSQTALTGVFVSPLTLLHTLKLKSAVVTARKSLNKEDSYLDSGNASSLAKA